MHWLQVHDHVNLQNDIRSLAVDVEYALQAYYDRND